MRIAMVTNNYTPYSGGVVSSINAIVAQLQALGHEVIIITLDFIGDHQDPSYVYRIKTCFKFTYRNNHMAVPWRARSQLQQILTQFDPDLIHVHQPFLLGPLAVTLGKKMCKKIIFTYHTLYQEYAHYVPAAPRKLTQKCIDLLVTSFCAQVDGIVAPTPGVKQLVPQVYNHKTQVIPSPLQHEFLMPYYVPKAKKDYFSLLTIGRMVPEKNIPWLLRMFAGLDPLDFKFVLAGYGSHFEQLKTYAYHTLKLCQSSVIFIHRPTKTQMKALHKDADLFVFASQTDTQALVLAESMAHGTPIIALDGIGQRHIIEQGHNGYLVHSHDQMRSIIQKIADNQEHHVKLQKKAFETSLQYHPSVLAQKMVNFYQKTL